MLRHHFDNEGNPSTLDEELPMEGGGFAQLSEKFARGALEDGKTGVVAHGFKEDGDSSPPAFVGEDSSVVVSLGIEEGTSQFLETSMGRELAQCLEAFFDVKVANAQLTGLLHLKVYQFGSSGRIRGNIGGVVGVVITIVIGGVIRVGGVRSVELCFSVRGIELWLG